MIAAALGFGLGAFLSVQAGQNEGVPRWDSTSTAMANAAIRHLFQKFRFLREFEGGFCLSAHGERPPSDLAARLRDIRQLRPLIGSSDFDRRLCDGFTVDVSGFKRSTPSRGQVKVSVDAPGAAWDCRVAVVRVSQGWTAETKQEGCVHFQKLPSER
jgi:hypothetical protein